MNPRGRDGVFDGPHYRLKDVLRLQAEVKTIRKRAASTKESESLIAQLTVTKRQAVEKMKQVGLRLLCELYAYSCPMLSIACDSLQDVVRICRTEA